MADYGDFLQAFQVGANVQNMAWQRQERMQQLRAQEALLRIKERMEAYEVQELVARRDKYFEDAMTTQADRIRKAAALKAAADMFPAKLQASGGDPMKALGDMVAPVSAVDPEVGAQLAQGYQRGMAGQMEGVARPLDPSAVKENEAQAALANARADYLKSGKTPSYAPDPTEKRAIARQRAEQAVQDAIASGDEAAIDKAQRFLTGLVADQARMARDPRDTAMIGILRNNIREIDKQLNDPLFGGLLNDTQKAELLDKREQLLNDIRNIGEPDEPAEKPAPASSGKKKFIWTPDGLKPK